MEAAKCVLQIKVEEKPLKIKYEQEKSMLLLPKFSKEVGVREEKLLLISEIPQEVLTFIEEEKFFTLVASDPNDYRINR